MTRSARHTKEGVPKYLNISFFIALPKRFRGVEQEKVKLLLVRYICLDSPPMSRSNALGDVMRREVVLYLASA